MCSRFTETNKSIWSEMVLQKAGNKQNLWGSSDHQRHFVKLCRQTSSKGYTWMTSMSCCEKGCVCVWVNYAAHSLIKRSVVVYWLEQKWFNQRETKKQKQKVMKCIVALRENEALKDACCVVLTFRLLFESALFPRKRGCRPVRKAGIRDRDTLGSWHAVGHSGVRG